MLAASNEAAAAPVAGAALVQPATTAAATAAAQPKVAYLGNGSAVRVANSIPIAGITTTPAAAIARAPLAVAQALPLSALVATYAAGAPLDEQGQCLATAVYFEARGESLEGQLAVANVVINRARSGRYPPSWCEVVKQPAQFSFVRHGQFPWIDTASASWATAQSIARIAALNVSRQLDQDVLWYHANYVAPSWGRRLTRVQQIGAHIFYRS